MYGSIEVSVGMLLYQLYAVTNTDIIDSWRKGNLDKAHGGTNMID